MFELQSQNLNLQKGRELYRQAAGEEVNEEIMQKAADLGDPNASLYIGKKMIRSLGKMMIDIYFPGGEVRIFNNAKPYLKTAAEADLPDSVFLYYLTVLKTESASFTYEKAYNLLKKLRLINQYDLSEEFQYAYSTALDELVGLVNGLSKIENERMQKEAQIHNGYSDYSYSDSSYSNDFTGYTQLTSSDHDDLDAIEKAMTE